jgi:hypothetical protein
MNRFSFALLLLMAVPLGCFAKPLPEAELRQRLAARAAERKHFLSVSSAYDLRISGRRPNGKIGRLSCSGRLVAARDRGLRMRGAKALGMAKIFDFLMVGDDFKLHFIYGKKFFVGSVSKALADRKAEALLGKGKPNLHALLFPVPAGEQWEKREMSLGRREAVVSWKRADGRRARRLVVSAVDARPLRTEIFGADGKHAAVIYYKKPLNLGEFHPVGGFKVRGAGRSRFRLDFSFKKMVINGKVKPAVFKLPPPPGVKPTDVDKRQAGKQEPSKTK